MFLMEGRVVCRHVGRKHAHSNTPCLNWNKNVFRGSVAITQYVGDWRYGEIFRTGDFVLWIERPCWTTEKHLAQEHEGATLLRHSSR